MQLSVFKKLKKELYITLIETPVMPETGQLDEYPPNIIEEYIKDKEMKEKGSDSN